MAYKEAHWVDAETVHEGVRADCQDSACAFWRERIAEIDKVVEQRDAHLDPEFRAATAAVYENARELLLKKHKDYGPTNISRSPGGPLNGLRVRIHDKTARINNLIDSGATPENESLRDSFLDLMNYAAIAQVVLDGNWPEQ